VSDRPCPRIDAPHLFGADGELVLLRISVEPKSLEELLDALAGLPFPVNPELQHRKGYVLVEFPAYEQHINEVRDTLGACGFDPLALQASGVLAAAAGA
jgi:hypothetical protein